MIPFEDRGGTQAQHSAAEAMELAILGDALVRRAAPAARSAQEASQPQRPETEARPTRPAASP